VNVDGSEPGNLKKPFGQNVPEGDHHEKIRRQTRYALNKLRGFNRFGLNDLAAESLGRDFNRRRFDPATPSPGTVRLGDDQDHVLSVLMQGLECGNGKLRSAEKNDFIGAVHCFLSCFMTRRLYNWRFKGLIRSIKSIPSR